MPNWCYTTLTVTGSANRVAEFIEFAKSKSNDSELTFDNFVPMPPSLHVESSSTAEMGHRIFHTDQWQGYLDYPWVKEANVTTLQELQAFIELKHPTAKALGQIYADNLTAYGHKTWYDWSIHHWGTKWYACNVQIQQKRGKLTTIKYSFKTAWSPAMPVFLAMSEKFPDLTFTATFDEEGDLYKFEATWFAGEQTEEINLMHS